MHTNGTTALARVQDSFDFTPDQRQMIRDTYANGASEQEFAVLMEVARARRLNPLMKQIHFVSRWDDQKKRYVWSTQISIDGLRAVAERTGAYDGQDEPEFIYDEQKKLVCAKVRIYRKGISRAFVGVAHFAEYAQKKKDGGLTSFWRDKPHVMLAKCAEALGIRKGFPEDTAGLYVPEEMGQSEGELVGEVVQRDAKPANGAPAPKSDPALPQKTVETFIEQITKATTEKELKEVGFAINREQMSAADRATVLPVYRQRKEALARAGKNGADPKTGEVIESFTTALPDFVENVGDQ